MKRMLAFTVLIMLLITGCTQQSEVDKVVRRKYNPSGEVRVKLPQYDVNLQYYTFLTFDDVSSSEVMFVEDIISAINNEEIMTVKLYEEDGVFVQDVQALSKLVTTPPFQYISIPEDGAVYGMGKMLYMLPNGYYVELLRDEEYNVYVRTGEEDEVYYSTGTGLDTTDLHTDE